MKIRSITCFFDPREPDAQAALDRLARLAEEGRAVFHSAGLEVQSVRLASVPFPLLYPADHPDGALRLAQTLEQDAASRGFAYLSLGPALPAFPASYRLVAPILRETRAVFLSGIMAAPETGVSLPAVRACAEIIAAAAPLEPGGFANLRFGALANLGPGGPFLPGAYHGGGRPAFALAVECADLALEAFARAGSLEDARRRLVTALEEQATALTSRAAFLSQKYGVFFGGIDFSPAPYPQDWCSLGGAIERLGIPALGLNGSLAAAAFLADALDRGRWLRAGFNGLMLPVLEDSVLARRSGQGSLTLRDLLLYSAVCGCGLDTVPLPGSATPGQISALLLDVAALALRLRKPLIARLMPIPGKAAGDATDFTFEFFANGRVMDLPAAPVEGLLAGEESFTLEPRRSA